MDGINVGDVLLLMVPIGLLIMLTLQQRRRRQELRAAQQAVLVGAKVMTGAGMFGTVASLEGDFVTLETAPGQTSVWLRDAIVRIIEPGTPTAPEAPSEAN